MMNRRWMSRTYREEVKDGAGEAGYQVADADALEDLYTDTPDSNSRPDPVAPEPVAPVAPVTPAAAPPTEPVAPAPVATPAAAPQTPPASVQPSAPAAPVVDVPVQPVQPPTVAQPPAEPVQPAEPVETDAQRTERLNGERVKLVGELERMYAIPEAELDTFRETPESYLPKMAAKLHVEVLTAVANGIYTQLPGLMQGILNAQKQQTSYEDKFFQRWGKLNTPDLRPKVLEMVGRYRQVNPTAPFETLMEEVGAMAHVRYRIPYEDAAVAPPQTPAPTQPANRPFVPAGAGGASPPPASTDNSNQFTQMAAEYLANPDGW